MSLVKQLFWVLIVACILPFCKKKKDGPPPIIPRVTTAEITNVESFNATGGGTLDDDGGATVTAVGVCWSKTNQLPTVANDTARGAVGDVFTAEMSNLQTTTTYYVRAFAVNSAGIGYGAVVTFNTTNYVPEARNVQVTGVMRVYEVIKARFTYFDLEQDPMKKAIYQWYIADDTTSDEVHALDVDGTDSIYRIKANQQGKFLRVEVTPLALTGFEIGEARHSKWMGPVLPPEQVTFNYNGLPVTYGVITSMETGRLWLDRNLGADGVATAFDDWKNYGDLFQWGRGADGHQSIIRRRPGQASIGVEPTTTFTSNGDVPGHPWFITPPAPFNWRTTINETLWQLPARTNNVCPTGWHVPTKKEWEDEHIGKQEKAYEQLKLTLTGFRDLTDGRVNMAANDGRYWSTDKIVSGTVLSAYALVIWNFSDGFMTVDNLPANGLAVRCIKD